MTSLIRLRQECPEIGWGEWQIIKTGFSQVLGMHYHWKGSSLLILHNLDQRAHEISLNLKLNDQRKLVDLLNDYESVADEKGQHRITLNAYGYRWFRGGDLSHLMLK